MNNEEALKKIEEINTILQSSNKTLISGRHMIIYGLMIWLVPIIGYFTQFLTFGHYFGNYQNAYVTLTNTVFFWILAYLIGKFVPHSSYYKSNRNILHPLIGKAFSISRPIVIAIIGAVLVLSLTNQSEYIYPVIFIWVQLF